MATRRYGISRGENDQQVTEAVGAATAADHMEFTFDLATNLTKEDVLLGLEKIFSHILKGNFPPA
jgi:hypothetical protein